MSKLAGLLTEGKEKEESDCYEAEDMEESEDLEESEEMEESEDMEESDDSMKEGYDIRRIIRDEIARSLNSRSKNDQRYSSGQVFGNKSTNRSGTVTMGFPGIGFKR
jgi:hypothetical protein